MNILEAKLLRDKGKSLMGRNDLEFEIIDVIVIPRTHTSDFFAEYRNYFNSISNDDMIEKYLSKEYFVQVIYHIGTDIGGEDIETYKNLIS